MLCEFVLVIGRRGERMWHFLSSDAVYPHGHGVMISQRLWWGNRVGGCEGERLDHPFSVCWYICWVNPTDTHTTGIANASLYTVQWYSGSTERVGSGEGFGPP